jgi:hypothetical protein
MGLNSLGVGDTPSYTILENVSDGGGALIDGGLLSFTSGGTTGANGITWNWGAGTPPGALSLVGCLSLDGIACIANETGNTVLISDEFTSATIENIGFGTPGISFGGLQGTLDPFAATVLGVGNAFVSPTATNTFGFEDNASPLPSTLATAPTAFSATQGQGTLDLVSVPEGASVASMLGMFVVGLGVFGVARCRRSIKPVAL